MGCVTTKLKISVAKTNKSPGGTCPGGWLAPLSSRWTGAEGAATVWIIPAEAWVGFSLEFKMSFPQQFIGQNLSQDPVLTGNAILPSPQKVESQEELVET